MSAAKYSKKDPVKEWQPKKPQTGYLSVYEANKK